MPLPGQMAYSLFLLLAHADVELWAPSPAPCLPVCLHASIHDNNQLNHTTINDLQLSEFHLIWLIFLFCLFYVIKSCCSHNVLHRNRNPN